MRTAILVKALDNLDESPRDSHSSSLYSVIYLESLDYREFSPRPPRSSRALCSRQFCVGLSLGHPRALAIIGTPRENLDILESVGKSRPAYELSTRALDTLRGLHESRESIESAEVIVIKCVKGFERIDNTETI